MTRLGAKLTPRLVLEGISFSASARDLDGVFVSR
jgi:hypothetical protein